MTEGYRHLDFRCKLAVPQAEVFRALTSVNALRDWFCDAAECDPRLGGRLYFWWRSGFHATGIFTQFEPDKALGFTWRGNDEPAATSVRVTLTSEGDTTQLALVHAGIPTGDPGWEKTIRDIKEGWQASLENLVSVLESGIDLRAARRPYLGINLADFNAETAKKIGVPVNKGIHLSEVVEGLGAAKAGLRAGDVIVAIDGETTPDFDALRRVIVLHQVGDVIPVQFYRGATLSTCQLELTARPATDYPNSAPALADNVRRVNHAFQKQLAEKLASCSDDRAALHPEANAWSIREILAHLILCERDLQTWIANMINDNEIADSLLYSPNVNPRVDALIAVYATLPDLQAELCRAHEETCALLERLPEEFVTRKHFFYRIAEWMQFNESHNREHLGEIEACLKN